MTGPQGGPPGQGVPPPGDQESTQVGMPVPPTQPAPYRPTVPGYAPQDYSPAGYGQPPAGYQPSSGYPPNPSPVYGEPPPPPGYGPPPGSYGYAAPPPPRRGGVSPVLLGLLVLLLVVGLGVGGMYLAHVGPFAGAASPTATLIGQATPTPTPEPTTTPTVAPSTLPPTAPPTTQPPTEPPTSAPPPTTAPPPTDAPTPPGSAAANEAALRSHVPVEFAGACTTSAVSAPAMASLLCTARDGAIVVGYTLYPDGETMLAAYDLNREIFAGDAGSETCETPDNWPSEYEYTISGEPSGRVFCADLGDTPQMYWTDSRFSILSWALFAGEGTRDDMYTFWQAESGPY